MACGKGRFGLENILFVISSKTTELQNEHRGLFVVFFSQLDLRPLCCNTMRASVHFLAFETTAQSLIHSAVVSCKCF
jgi:hypothetical protein